MVRLDENYSVPESLISFEQFLEPDIMSKPQSRIRFTRSDYKNLPESEVNRYELMEGDLVMVPSPSWRHQQISLRLALHLADFVRSHRLGAVAQAPLDVVLGQDIAQPDILFVASERLGIVSELEVCGAPDLVVEILSPATAQRDRTFKRTLYARHGVPEYWLVDPESETIEVLRLGPAGFRRAGLYGLGQSARSLLLAGLEIPVDEIFFD